MNTMADVIDDKIFGDDMGERMEAQDIKKLQQQLALKQKELDLILAIDDIRDMMSEPSTMMTALAGILARQIDATLCGICLVERDTQRLILKAVSDRSGQFGYLDSESLHELHTCTTGSQDIFVWSGDDIPPLLQSRYVSEDVCIAVVPICLNGERLGLIVLTRTGTGFGPDDIELIKIAESQVDSAVIQAWEYHTLQQRNKELEAIYQIDNIRDRHLSFDQMLSTVLGALRKIIQAEAGFIMLYNESERRLDLRANTKDDLFPFALHAEAIHRIASESLQQSKMVWYNEFDPVLRSIMCLPLILENKIIGVLGVINRYGQQGFDSEDRRLLSAIASQMDTAIFESLEKRHLRDVLGRSVDPNIMERLLSSSGDDMVNCERSVLSVLYADLRGSTALAEHTEPERLLRFINDYLGQMTDVILAQEGTLDKFVGDEVMALFGAPFPQADHALRAIHVAIEMQAEHQKIMAAWEGQGVTPCPIGIGIASGELIVGEVGCKKRTDYTVIGRAANLGARICSVAKGGEILISQETYNLVQDQIEVEPIVGVKMKGIPDDVTIYRV